MPLIDMPLFALLLAPIACLCLEWLAAQSIVFLVACRMLPEALWPHTWDDRSTHKMRVLRRINFWLVLLAWTSTRLRRSALAPRSSAGFAVLSGVVALFAFIAALLLFLITPLSFQPASPLLDCFSILFSWLSVLLLPHQSGDCAKSKAKEHS